MPLIERDTSASSLTIRWALRHPVAATWSHLRDRSRLGAWLGEPIRIDGAIGALIEIDHGQGYVCRSLVKACDPVHHSFVVSWEFPDEHETEVVVVVEPLRDASDAAQLTLVHHGLGGLLDSYADGWVTHLMFFEASLDGAPLPPEEFWSLHATVRALGLR
ncbi:SRPBCC domain-containing protein [Microbacterium sp.]|uniref:SRPBCC domain-containing protein n=1 Tax=Microbacterium sp. TaxID=51671 RepID=UPI003C766ED8